MKKDTALTSKNKDKTEKLVMLGLRKGMTTAEISEWLKKKKHKPNSIPTIENKIAELKKRYGSKTLFQLGYRLKKKNLI